MSLLRQRGGYSDEPELIGWLENRGMNFDRGELPDVLDDLREDGVIYRPRVNPGKPASLTSGWFGI